MTSLSTLVLFAGLMLTLGLGPTLAQGFDIDDIEAQNAALGSGCNGIGYAVEGPTAPLAPTQEWIDEHSACTSTGILSGAQCQGALLGDRRYELCALFVIKGDAAYSVNCQDFQMYTELGLYGPDPQKTDEYMPQFAQAFAGHNLAGAEDIFQPCTKSPALSDGTAIVSVFDLDRTEGHVAFRGRVGEGIGNQVVFIVTDQRQEVPS